MKLKTTEANEKPEYSGPGSSLLPAVSRRPSQILNGEFQRWRIPELNNPKVLNRAPFWAAWWNLALPHGAWLSISPRPTPAKWPRCSWRCSGELSPITVPELRSPRLHWAMAPKHEGGDAGGWDMPRRSHHVLPLSDSGKVHDLIRKETNKKMAR